MLSDSASSGTVAPSITSFSTAGFSSATRLSACATSGQLVQVSDTNVRSFIGPFNASMRPRNIESGRFFPWPSALSTASSKVVNSCPLGIPQKLIPEASPFLRISNPGASTSAWTVSTESFGDVDATSSRNDFISVAWGESSRAIILKVISDFSPANIPFNWFSISWSNMIIYNTKRF